MSDRRKYTAAFKADAVELVLTSQRPIAQIAPEIGVNEGTLGNWVRAWRQEHPEAGLPILARWNGPNISRYRQRTQS